MSLFFFTSVAILPEPYPSVTSNVGHDPSAAQRTKDGYVVTLVTGSGGGEAFGMKYLDPANYEAGWHAGEMSYLNPSWLKNNNTNWGACTSTGKADSVCSFWAPDLPSNGNGFLSKGGVASDDFTMYYSLCPPKDTQGKPLRFCIGKAMGKFLAPTHSRAAAIDWRDSGSPVVCTSNLDVDAGSARAIDPSVGMDKNGQLWLTYGSYSAGGIMLVELNAKTGELADEVLASCRAEGKFPYCWGSSKKSAFHNVANHWCNSVSDGCAAKYLGGGNMLEASYLYQRQETGELFLFVNYYWCCRGMQSTYEIRVGRSASGSAVGPFLDREGKSMAEHGGSLLLGSRTDTSDATIGKTNAASATGHVMVGPGHAGVLRDIDGRFALSFDFMAVDGDARGDTYRNQLRALEWDNEGWPIVTNRSFFPAKRIPMTRKGAAGKYSFTAG